MNIKSSEKKETTEVEYIIDISSEEFDAAIGEVYKKNRNQIAVPGFRKGKAPRKIIERMYGASIFHNDALDNILPQVLDFVFENAETKHVGLPQVDDVDIREDGGVDITIVAAVYPEVKLGEYKGISAEKPVADVPDSDIDAEIEAIRLRNARIEKADRAAQNEDTAVIDFEGIIDGKPFDGGSGTDYELELGSKTFIPGFEEKIVGMTVGEERDLDLVFPDNYEESLAGKPVLFKVKLNDLKEKILPDVDDEFVKDVSEFDTIEEYRQSIREKFLKEKQTNADDVFENSLMEKIISSMEADVPEVMVEEQLDNAMNNFVRQVSSYGMDPEIYLQMTNTTPEQLRENLRVSSEKQVRTMLALEKIAEIEGIEVTDEDIENEYKEAAERFSAEIDKLKESVSEETIRNDIKLRRAAMVVIDNAIAEEPSAEPTPQKKAKAQTNEEKPQKAAAKKPATRKTKAEPAGDSDAAVAQPDISQAVTEASATTTEKKPAAKKSKPKTDADAAETVAPETDVAVKKPAAKKTKKPEPKTDDEG